MNVTQVSVTQMSAAHLYDAHLCDVHLFQKGQQKAGLRQPLELPRRCSWRAGGRPHPVRQFADIWIRKLDQMYANWHTGCLHTLFEPEKRVSAGTAASGNREQGILDKG
jgi:hypothetical protein